MARETIKEKLAERYQPDQPALFDQDGEPAHSAVLALVVARRYEHTGVRLTEDESKCQRLVELLQLRWGVARISREMCIAKATVRAARRTLAVQGKIGPYQQRVMEGMEDAIEAGVYAYRDAQENGKIAPAQIPVGVGIFWDKRAASRGEPTTIQGTAKVQTDRSPDAVNRAFAHMKICNSEGEMDSASSVTVPNHLQLAGGADSVATLVATPGREIADCMADGPPRPLSSPVAPLAAPDPPPAPVRLPAAPDGGGMDRAEGRLTQPNRFGNLICKKSFVMTKSITNAVKNLLPTKKTAPPGAGPVEWLIVWSASTKNRRLLLCYKMGMDPTNPTQLIALIVRDNQNFRPDMRVPAREFAEGYYEYAGRLPRWRGEQLQSAAKL